jgi:hypothetical protein
VASCQQNALNSKEMGTPLTGTDITNLTNALKNHSVSSGLQGVIEQQGDVKTLIQRMKNMRTDTQTMNREFSERYQVSQGMYKLPIFGTNQDIFLLLFYFSFIFLVIVSLILVYKNTGSMRNVLYGTIASFLVILIVTGVMLRIA